VEQIVGHVFQNDVQELAGHRRAVHGGVVHRGRVVQGLAGDRLARQQARPPAEAGAQRDVGLALLDQRLADQIVEGAVEIAPAVEQRLGGAENLVQFGLERGPDAVDQRRHLGVRSNDIGEDRDQLVANALDARATHIEIDAAGR